MQAYNSYVATLEAQIRELQDSPRSSESPRARRRSAPMASPLVSNGSVQPYLPSNQQLVQGMPADYDIPWIAGASRQDALSDTTFDRSILPDGGTIDQLVDHYWHFTNSAYPIHHGPTFRRQLLLVCDREGAARSIDICTVLCKCSLAALKQ